MCGNFSALHHLECTWCGEQFSKTEPLNLCPACQHPLFARYDLNQAGEFLTKNSLKDRDMGLWRYHEVLPVERSENILTLGEGGTPLVPAKRLGEALGFEHLYLKDESLNPTGSFKARGLSAAVSKANEFGIRKVALPTAGNAGGAAAAYAAKGGMQAFVVMPSDTPAPFLIECEQCGAEVERINGLISDCAKRVAEKMRQESGWFDLSTLKEPYRVEGKKTMAYELAEQLGWSLPDVIVYPTGGGTGLIGMWKAFDEMEQLGWIGKKRPRMISVQADGCAPMVEAFLQGREKAIPLKKADTLALGLRVPGAVGDFLILRALRESGGLALAVSDEALMQGVRTLGVTEGIFAAPEGGAAVAAIHALKDEGVLRKQDRIVLFITGGGAKYASLFS